MTSGGDRQARRLAENDAPRAYELAKRLDAEIPADAAPADRALALNLLARIELYLAMTDRAAGHAGAALALADQHGDRIGQAEALLTQALNSVNQGDIAALIASSSRSLTVVETVARPDLVSEAFLRTSMMYRRIGKIEESVRVAMRGMEMAKRSNDPVALIYAHQGLGISFDQSFRYAEARTHFTAMLDLARKVGYRLQQGYATGSLGGVAASLGDAREGERLIREAIDHYRAVGAPFAVAFGPGRSTASPSPCRASPLGPDGAIRWVHDRAFPIRDATGRVYRIAGVAEDVTRRRGLEDQLRQAQKMEAIGRLAGGVAHDFNNLLAVIQMQSALLLSLPAGGADTVDGLQQIMAAAERAANLTRQLLTFSRQDVRQSRDLDLGEVTDRMARLLRRVLGEDVALETQVAGALPLVNADPGMMEQVLMNLAVNARDAMPGGGRLRVALEVVEIDSDEAAERPRGVPGRFVRLRVEDTGCGIPAEDLPRIFEPFFTTKEAGRGTGLGLATVFGIVEQHQGWIDVRSEVGHGSTFEIHLPALATEVQHETADAAARGLPGGTESILLVEDDPAVRRLTRASLEHCGYRVHEAESATAALAIWDTLPQPVDLLLTDLIMPGGMTGRELADRLVARRPGLKVIYNSGYSSEVVQRELRLLPTHSFLQKPYPVAELAAAVRDCLDRPTG